MNSEPLLQVVKQHESDLKEYYYLGLKPKLDSKEEDRIGEILQLAEDDEFLNSILIEIDEIIAQKQDLISEELYAEYKDQISWMREYLIQHFQTND